MTVPGPDVNIQARDAELSLAAQHHRMGHCRIHPCCHKSALGNAAVGVTEATQAFKLNGNILALAIQFNQRCSAQRLP